MKLQLKYFLAFSILLGAIGLPWMWKVYHARRAEEIERLEKKLAARRNALAKAKLPRGYWSAADQHRLETLQSQIVEIETRLEKLTGRPPRRTETAVPPKMGQPSSPPPRDAPASPDD